MEQIIKIFENEEFGKVRTVIKDGEPWWILKDICQVLEMKANSAGEVVKRLDKDEYDSIGLTDSLGRKQKAYVVNESGLYSILVRSDKPKAKPFRKWLTSEVIPTIRRTGGYVANEEMFIENYLPFLEEPYQNLFRLQMTAIRRLNERIRHDQPLVEFANQVSNTDNLINMNSMAKIARAENIPVGRNKLYGWLKGKGVLMANNLPYQRYIDRGYFAVKESVFEVDGMKKTYQQTFVTGKGQLFVISLLKKVLRKGACVMYEKPKCPLIGQNGNIFNLMGIASRTLKRNGMSNESKEMCSRITSSGSYDEALSIIDEYVEITSVDEEETEDFEMEMM